MGGNWRASANQPFDHPIDSASHAVTRQRITNPPPSRHEVDILGKLNGRRNPLSPFSELHQLLMQSFVPREAWNQAHQEFIEMPSADIS